MVLSSEFAAPSWRRSLAIIDLRFCARSLKRSIIATDSA